MLVAFRRRHLTAQRMSAVTVATCSPSVAQLDPLFAEHPCRSRPPPSGASTSGRSSPSLLERWKPATAHNRYRALNSFLGWLLDEGEISESHLARMRPPRLP